MSGKSSASARWVWLLLASLVLCAFTLDAQSPSMLGDWRESSGSVIRIESCASGLCLRLVALGPKAPSPLDIHNPDAALRSRPLCGLVIGTRFQMTDTAHASGGFLYDPKSGNTYRGGMTLEGNVLRLRGYVGLPLFGRTESWQRNTGQTPACATANHP